MVSSTRREVAGENCIRGSALRGVCVGDTHAHTCLLMRWRRVCHQERSYKHEPMVDQLETHYATDGYVLPKGSDEAKRQMELEKMEADAEADFARMINPPKDADCMCPSRCLEAPGVERYTVRWCIRVG